MCNGTARVLASLAATLLCLPAQATVMRPVDLETLARRADVIVRGTTEATVASLTEDGKQIHTVAILRVRSVLKGALAPEIEVRTPGGTIGDIAQVVQGAPQLSKGEEVILFLHRVSERRFTIEGFALGKYQVIEGPGGTYLTQDLRNIGLLGPDGVVRPGTTVEPIPERAFLARVRKALEGPVAP